MPALSPTMTEGNIASWRVKEGASFSAGDVLLEIETDKATMDVEAQDDGVMVKIFQADGTKGVKVGQRIGVTAEAGDDAATVEIPADEQAASPSAKPEEAKPEPKKEAAEKPAPASSQSSPTPAAPKTTSPQPPTPSKKQKPQSYPLYPSVSHLLHLNNLSASDADSIPASGPNGRLLKGDVLAYLGQIGKDYSSKESARLTRLSHLDLSNIQIAKVAVETKAPTATAATEIVPDLPQETEIAVPISLSAVIATQKRVQDSTGIFLPLSTFIARASELANDSLPLSKNRKPTADELFNSVLGLDKVASKVSRGNYIPQVTGLTPLTALQSAKRKAAKKPDILDLLVAKPATKKSVSSLGPGSIGVTAGNNVFSVTAKIGEEKRASEYLGRMKMALEKEPGRLVL